MPLVRAAVVVDVVLSHVGPEHVGLADGMVGVRARPPRVEGLIAREGAHEHVVLAVHRLDDLAIPVVVVRVNACAFGALDAVGDVSRKHARHPPGGRGERRDRGSRLDVLLERLGLRRRGDAETQSCHHARRDRAVRKSGCPRNRIRGGMFGRGERQEVPSSRTHTRLVDALRILSKQNGPIEVASAGLSAEGEPAAKNAEM